MRTAYCDVYIIYYKWRFFFNFCIDVVNIISPQRAQRRLYNLAVSVKKSLIWDLTRGRFLNKRSDLCFRLPPDTAYRVWHLWNTIFILPSRRKFKVSSLPEETPVFPVKCLPEETLYRTCIWKAFSVGLIICLIACTYKSLRCRWQTRATKCLTDRILNIPYRIIWYSNHFFYSA